MLGEAAEKDLSEVAMFFGRGKRMKKGFNALMFTILSDLAEDGQYPSETIKYIALTYDAAARKTDSGFDIETLMVSAERNEIKKTQPLRDLARNDSAVLRKRAAEFLATLSVLIEKLEKEDVLYKDRKKQNKKEKVYSRRAIRHIKEIEKG